MNTLSSLSFLVTAYMLSDIHDCFHFTWMLVLLTISTMLMHGSGSYFWGTCDMASMFLCVTYSLLKNNEIHDTTCLSMSLLSFLLCFLSKTWVHLNTFIALATLWILSFLPLFCSEVLIGYIVFLVSLILWIQDINKKWCMQYSFIQGHALWHIGSAIGFYFLLKQHGKIQS